MGTKPVNRFADLRSLSIPIIVALVFSLAAVVLPQSKAIAQQLLYWAKTYGGSGYDYAHSIQQTSDGGYIVAGSTESFGAGGKDFWVLKLDSSGTVEWQKTYGGGGNDWNSSIQQTSDGGYIVAGSTESFGAGGKDFWVLKLDSNGTVMWQKTYGGSSYDGAYSIQQTQDGGYIVAGSFGGDAWVLKLNSSGNVQWQKTYGGSSYDFAHSIQQTEDGGYIVAGETESFGAGGYDFWVLKLDSSGNVEWQKTYGGNTDDYNYTQSIQQTSDGGYIMAGETYSFGVGWPDFWVLKVDSSSNVEWQKTYGGSEWDRAHSIQQTSDGGYIVAGCTESFGAGWDDSWVLKLDQSGNVLWQKTYGDGSYDHASSIQQTSDGGYIVAGDTESFGAGWSDAWVLKLDSSGGIPECPLIGDSNAIVNSTSVVGITGEIVVSDTNGAIGTPTITVKDTSCTVVTQCHAVCIVPGDINKDGKTDVLDVRLCLQIANGYLTPTAAQQTAADVDQDGDVDFDDATLLARYIIGIVDRLGNN